MRKTMTVMVLGVLGMIFLVGCATSGDFKTLKGQVRKIALGVEECQQFIQVDFDEKLKETDIKLANLEGFKEGVGERFNSIEEEIKNIKASTGLYKAASAIEAPVIEATEEKKTVVVPLALRVDRLTARVDKLERKLYPNLYAYVKDINRRFNVREAKYRFAGDPTGKLTAYLVGPFPIDKFGLTTKIKKQLRKAKTDIKNNNLKPVGIDAFASIGGDLDHNQILSETRAKIVAGWLKEEKMEIPADKVRGLGETTEFGRAKDNQCAIIFAASASSD